MTPKFKVGDELYWKDNRGFKNSDYKVMDIKLDTKEYVLWFYTGKCEDFYEMIKVEDHLRTAPSKLERALK